jgi:hypothetical protein
MKVEKITRGYFYIQTDDNRRVLTVDLGDKEARLPEGEQTEIVGQIAAVMERMLQKPAAQQTGKAPSLFDQDGKS